MKVVLGYGKTNSFSQFKIEEVLEYILIASLIFFDARSFFGMYMMPFVIQKLIQVICIIGIVFYTMKKNRNLKLNRWTIYAFLILIVSLFMSVVLNLDTSMKWMEVVVMLVLAFSISNSISYKKFVKKYINIMLAVSIYSLVVFAFSLCLPDLFQRIVPTFHHLSSNSLIGYITIYNAGFSYVYFGEGYLRNFGPFSEPGFFQFFILVALILYVTENNNKTDRKFNLKIAILLIAAYSTFSVVGVICTSLVVIGIIVKKKDDVKFTLKLILGLLLGCILIQKLGFMQVISKLFTKFQGGDSFRSRYGSFIGAVESWALKPVFGWGYTGATLGKGAFYLDYSIHMTNTTFYMFSCYGIFYGLIYFVGQMKCMFCKNANLFFVVAFLLSLNGETYFNSLFAYVLMFYGYAKNSLRVKNEKN